MHPFRLHLQIVVFEFRTDNRERLTDQQIRLLQRIEDKLKDEEEETYPLEAAWDDFEAELADFEVAYESLNRILHGKASPLGIRETGQTTEPTG